MKPLRISGDSSAAVPQQLDDIARAMTVRQLSEGEAHGIAVTSLGACYVWGDLSFTGRPADAARADEPRLQPRLEHISVSRVAAGDEHCVVVTEDHGVYAWGRNREGQCGTGPSSPPGQICPPEPIDDRVVSSFCHRHPHSSRCGQQCLRLLAADSLHCPSPSPFFASFFCSRCRASSPPCTRSRSGTSPLAPVSASAWHWMALSTPLARASQGSWVWAAPSPALRSRSG